MASPQTPTKVAYQGLPVALDVFFYDPSFNLIDPDAIPGYSIKNPSNVVIQTGLGVKVSLGHWKVDFLPASDAPVGIWSIAWTATIGTRPVANSIDTFQMAPAGSRPVTQQVQISDQWIRQIKAVLAFPGVDHLLLDQATGTDDEFKEFVVFPAMQEYFRRFPLENRQEYAISAEVTLPFPDAETFGATNCGVVEKFGSVSTASSFWDIVRFQTMYGGSSGTLSTSNGLGAYGHNRMNLNGMRQSFMTQRQVAQTYTNMYNTIKASVNEKERNLTVYSSVDAKVVIAWAKYSLDFDNDVRYVKKRQVIELAQSYLLNHLADAAGLLTDENLKKKLNAEVIKARAQELYDRITKSWDSDPGAVILIRQG